MTGSSEEKNGLKLAQRPNWLGLQNRERTGDRGMHIHAEASEPEVTSEAENVSTHANDGVCMMEAANLAIPTGGQTVERPVHPVIRIITLGDDSPVDRGLEQIDAGVQFKKPSPNEEFRLAASSVIATELLPVRRSAGMKESIEFFAVSEDLREQIADRLRIYRVLPVYIFATRSWALWPVSVNSTGWCRAIQRMLMRPAEFFATHSLMVHSDLARGQYVVRARPRRDIVPPPPGTTVEMLAEALGADNIIADTQHPMFIELTAGEVVS